MPSDRCSQPHPVRSKNESCSWAWRREQYHARVRQIQVSAWPGSRRGRRPAKMVRPEAHGDWSTCGSSSVRRISVLMYFLRCRCGRSSARQRRAPRPAPLTSSRAAADRRGPACGPQRPGVMRTCRSSARCRQRRRSACSRSSSCLASLHRDQTDCDEVQQADEPVAEAVLHGLHDCVAQRNHPVVLDQDEGHRGVVRISSSTSHASSSGVPIPSAATSAPSSAPAMKTTSPSMPSPIRCRPRCRPHAPRRR